ncbi:MAG: hypothetical protein LUE98_15395 [Tannerellaceae bacterium]|nr:hypothetical protein [Tannerellaceae bacterium]
MEAKDVNSYRLTSLEEPTDSQLSALMKAVAKEAKEKSEAANRQYFNNMFVYIEKKKQEWSAQYNVTFNNA